MNAYGGEGPAKSGSSPSTRSRGRPLEDEDWDAAAQAFEAWVHENKKMPNQRAKNAAERDHALWWKWQKQNASTMAESRRTFYETLQELE